MKHCLGILLGLLAFAALPTGSLAGDVAVTIRSGESFVRLGTQGVEGRLLIGKSRYKRRHRYDRHERRSRLGWPGPARRGNGLHGRQNRTGSAPDHYDHGKRGRLFLVPSRPRQEPLADRVRNDPPAKPVAPPPVPPEEPVITDPVGASRIVVARGAPLPPVIDAGAFLPAGQPHVVLDPVRHGLTPPAPGQVYVRFRGVAYLIVATTRQVVERLS